MKYKFLLVFFILSSEVSIASNIDGLLHGLKTAPEKNKAAIHNQLAFHFLKRNIDESLAHGKKALEYSRKYKQKKSELKSLEYIGFAYIYKSDYSNAFEYFKSAVKLAEKMNNLAESANILNNIGNIYEEIESYGLSLKYYKQALAYFQKINDQKGEGRTLNNIGVLYKNMQDYNNSLKYFIKSLKIKEKIHDHRGTANTLNNLGNIYRIINDNKNALELYQKSLITAREFNDMNAVANAMNNIGLVHLSYKNYPKAMEYFIKAYKIHNDQNNARLMASSLNNIANSFEYMEIIDSSLYYYQIANKRFYELDFKKGIAISYTNIGSLFKQKKNYDSANYYLQKGIILAKEENQLDIMRDAYLSLSELYQETGNKENELRYYKQYSELKDTIISQESRKKMNELFVKYETEKKEKDLELLVKSEEIHALELKTQRIYIYILIIGIILIAFITFIIFNRLRLKNKLEKALNKRNKQLEDYSINLEKEIEVRKETEAKLFKAKEDITKSLKMEKDLNELKTRFISMVSHEYRTPLTVILSSTYLLDTFFENGNKNDYDKHLDRIRNSVDSMIKLLNDVLVIGRSEIDKMEYYPKMYDISELIQEAITEHQLIDKEKHIFYFQNPHIPVKFITDKKIFKQIFDNLLSNAMKYSPASTNIEINLDENNEEIVFSVTDRGIGIPEEESKHLFEPFHRFSNVGNISGTGLGLSIVKMSVEKLNGQINVVSGENKGTKIIVNLPK